MNLMASRVEGLDVYAWQYWKDEVSKSNGPVLQNAT